MDPVSRDRFGPNFNHFKSSLAYLIRDTEQNLAQGVSGTTDQLTSRTSREQQPNPYLPSSIHQEEKEYELPTSSRSQPPASARRTARGPPSPPLSNLDHSVEPPVITPSGMYPTTTTTSIPISYTVQSSQPPSAMNALQSQFVRDDTIAAVSASARESAEQVQQLTGMMTAFKSKMRSAFDINMSTLDKKVRLIRKDILQHISATVAELEKRMVDHLAKGVIGSSDPNSAALDAEFKKTTQEEFLFLKAELNRAQFQQTEIKAEAERQKRTRDLTFNTIQSKQDEHTSQLQDLSSTVYNVEKESVLMRTEMEGLRTKLRRDLNHGQQDSQNKFIDLAKGMAEMKKTLEGMIRREEVAEAEKIESQTQLIAHINSAAQTYLDEQLYAHSTTIKQLKRTQLLQSDELERLKKELATVRSRKLGGLNLTGGQDVEDEDGSTTAFLSKTLANITLRLDSLERENKGRQQHEYEQEKLIESLRQAIEAREHDTRQQLMSQQKSLRDDFSRLEKDGARREQEARSWREELNSWSRNLEQTILNLKYSVNNSVMLNSSSQNLGASTNTSSLGIGIASGSSPTGSGISSKDILPFLEHPSSTGISQALSTFEATTNFKLQLLEKELQQLSANSNADVAKPSAAPVAASTDLTALTNSVTNLETQTQQLKSSQQQLQSNFSNYSATLRDLQQQLQQQQGSAGGRKESHSESPRASTLDIDLIDSRINSRMDVVDLNFKELADALENANLDLRDQDARVAQVEETLLRESAELRNVQIELKRQATLQTYQHQLHVAAGSANPSATAITQASPTNKAPILPRTVPASVVAQVLTASSTITPTNQSPHLHQSLLQSSQTSPASRISTVERVPDSPMVAKSPASAARTPVTAGSSTSVKSQQPHEFSLDEASGQPKYGEPIAATVDDGYESTPEDAMEQSDEAELIQQAQPPQPKLSSLNANAADRKSQETSPSLKPTGLPRHPAPSSAVTSATATSQSAAAATGQALKPRTLEPATGAQVPVSKPSTVVPKSLEDASESESSEEEDEEEVSPMAQPTPAASQPLPSKQQSISAAAQPTAQVVNSNLPPLQSSLSPTGVGHDFDEDEDQTNGVPHSILSKQVKQRYMDAEAAGQVDGEAELDEDSLYDPEVEDERNKPLSERALRIAAAHQKHQQAHVDEDEEDDLGLDTTVPEQDQSLNTKFRQLQAGASAHTAAQYNAAHAVLQSAQSQWDSEEAESSESEGEPEQPIHHTTTAGSRPPGSALLQPGFSSPYRQPLSNPAISELSPLGKQSSQLKSNLGSVKPSAVSTQASQVLKTPAFMKAPLGSPKAAQQMLAGQSVPKPLPQPLPSRSSLQVTHPPADEFEFDEEDISDDLSSLSQDYRNLGQSGHGGDNEFDDDLSSPRTEDLRSPSHSTSSKPSHSASQRTAHATSSQRVSHPSHGHATHEGSLVSELDQLELSASHDAFNTAF